VSENKAPKYIKGLRDIVNVPVMIVQKNIASKNEGKRWKPSSTNPMAEGVFKYCQDSKRPWSGKDITEINTMLINKPFSSIKKTSSSAPGSSFLSLPSW
jgi:hypothetical protein